jgi:hypothetical protein
MMLGVSASMKHWRPARAKRRVRLRAEPNIKTEHHPTVPIRLHCKEIEIPTDHRGNGQPCGLSLQKVTESAERP